MPTPINPKLRFLAKVEITCGCWVWKGGLSSKRYGHFYDGSRMVNAHIFSYKLYKGEIPQGYYVCHKCDNTLCVNPDHLFIGTQKENIQDMINKGRMNYVPSNGEKNGNHKLTLEAVNKIKVLLSQGCKATAIARQYGMHHSTIMDIRDGVTWNTNA